MAIREGSSYKDRPVHTKSVGSRAFEHALDIELMIIDRMEELGLRKKDLAKKAGMTQSGLSNFLNGQPNMTLETMARFEVALDAAFEISLVPVEKYSFSTGAVEDHPDERLTSHEGDLAKNLTEERSYHLRASQREGAMLGGADTVCKSFATTSDKELYAA